MCVIISKTKVSLVEFLRTSCNRQLQFCSNFLSRDMSEDQEEPILQGTEPAARRASFQERLHPGDLGRFTQDSTNINDDIAALWLIGGAAIRSFMMSNYVEGQ